MLQGIKALKAKQAEEAEKAAARNRPRANWFTKPFPKETGNPVKVQFLQELDAEDPGYDEKKGLATAVVEHQAPGGQGYKRRATCTIDTEGRCYACEKHQQNYQEGWRQRTNFYVNVSIEGQEGAFVLSRNFNSSFVEDLIQEQEDEGSIVNAVYRIKKSGEGPQTKWTLKRLKDEDPWDVSGIEPWNIQETVVHDIPYEEQEKFYGAVYKPEAPEEAFDTEKDKSNVADEW